MHFNISKLCVMLCVSMCAAQVGAAAKGMRGDVPKPILVTSAVKGLHVVLIKKLHNAPSRKSVSESCAYAVIEPITAAGKAAAAIGWHVTSEEALGRYFAVGIFSDAHDGTSNTCLISDGKVVVFEGDNPIAVVYASLATGKNNGPIGEIVKTTLSNTLHILDGTPAPPTADLKVTPEGLAIVPLANTDPACGGRVQVPNVWGRSFSRARAKLAKYGWHPVPYVKAVSSDDTYDDPNARELRKQGIVEVDQCAGTGWGFCLAHYKHVTGAMLELETIGDGPELVSRYAVTCPN
ncbi:MAG: hypothetical protein KGI64_04735 [Xanthomonadaceae bacterium]|nr:hypothetical protein [Xanthomonadaceae bacterium]